MGHLLHIFMGVQYDLFLNYYKLQIMPPSFILITSVFPMFFFAFLFLTGALNGKQIYGAFIDGYR